MKIEIPFEIGQTLFFLVREEYMTHECDCPNCDGTSKVSISKSVHVTCRRCENGKLRITDKKYRVAKESLHGIVVRVDAYQRSGPDVTFSFKRYIHSFDCKFAYDTEAEAISAAQKLNKPIEDSFELKKEAAELIESMDYSDETD